jgi:hypothetical protein
VLEEAVGKAGAQAVVNGKLEYKQASIHAGFLRSHERCVAGHDFIFSAE